MGDWVVLSIEDIFLQMLPITIITGRKWGVPVCFGLARRRSLTARRKKLQAAERHKTMHLSRVVFLLTVCKVGAINTQETAGGLTSIGAMAARKRNLPTFVEKKHNRAKTVT